MSLFSMLKRNSKLALRGNWGKAVGIWCICLAAYLVLAVLQQLALEIFVPTVWQEPSYTGNAMEILQNAIVMTPAEVLITCIFTILSLLLLQPLSLGLVGWHYRLVFGNTDSVSEVFRFFDSVKNYSRSLWYAINLWVRTMLWSLAFFVVPSGVLVGALYFLELSEDGAVRTNAAIASVGLFLTAVLFLLALLFYAAYMNKYTLTPYLLCADDSLGVRQAIRLSVQYTRGFRFSLLWFNLSFLGWLLLCVFFLPVLYVMPYMNTAKAMYARYIIEKNRYQQPEPTQEFQRANGAEEPLPADHEIDPPPADTAE